MFHELKLELAFLKPIYNGEKTFEIRKNDRGFQKGDRIRFKAVDALGLHMRTNLDEMEFEITYVLSGWGLEPGFVAFGIKPLPPSAVAAGGGLTMTADEIAYDELCIGCTDKKRCRDNPVDCCDRYIARVEELEDEG